MTRIRTILLAVGFAGLFVIWGLAWTAKHIEHVGSGIAPLRERVFDGFQVITLGTGSDRINQNRAGPSIGIAFQDELLLIDAGAGVVESMRTAEIPARQPKAVVLTSLLPENLAGLDDLFMARAQEEANGLHVIGPKGSKEALMRLWKSLRGPLDLQAEVMVLEDPSPPEISEITELESLAVGDFKLHTVNVGKLSAELLAYRVEHRNKSVLVAGRAYDTKPLISFGRGSDLWVHGAHVREAVEAAIGGGAPETTREATRSWTALEDLGALATQMNVRALVLIRLTPPPIFKFQYKRLVGRTFTRPVFVADDRDVYSP